MIANLIVQGHQEVLPCSCLLFDAHACSGTRTSTLAVQIVIDKQAWPAMDSKGTLFSTFMTWRALGKCTRHTHTIHYCIADVLAWAVWTKSEGSTARTKVSYTYAISFMLVLKWMGKHVMELRYLTLFRSIQVNQFNILYLKGQQWI